ncbi:MAG: VOC family protein [Atopobiaceae bacterium]|nr:VOC family protein [Atopobiaceae bacterium]
MRAKMIHRNIHVLDYEKSIAFYEKALCLKERRRKGPEDGSWLIIFMGNDEADFELELTWNNGWTEPYNNGNGDTHLAVRVDDYDAFHALHEEMGCIVKENPKMGLYFIVDPDGCWTEILPNLETIPLEAERPAK